MILDYQFKDESLIQTAFTHSSYANEHEAVCNERLEFLGDAILGFVVGAYIYKKYPNLPEGRLTKLRANVVCETMLAKKGREIKLNDNLRLGRGEENSGGRDRSSIIADAMEAVIGAIYLDGGIEPAQKFILNMLIPEIEAVTTTVRILDTKTCLQEILQKHSQALVEYKIVKESGPAHSRVFTAEVSHKGKLLGIGEGHSKKEAEQEAAMAAIKAISK